MGANTVITYLKGDATRPVGGGVKYIVHVCNDRGGWGRGFVLAISARWPEPEEAYRSAFAENDLTLGDTQYVIVEKDLTVINMVAQKGYGKGNQGLHRTSEPDDGVPLQYDVLELCLSQVATIAESSGASVHMPRIGCGLAGGTWDRVEPIIQKTLKNIDVYVYDP